MVSIGLDLHITPTNLSFQSRLERATRFMQKSGIFTKVEIAGISRAGLLDIEATDDGRILKRFRVHERLRKASRIARALDFFIWYFRVAFHYTLRPLKCINAHSISVLPLCWTLSVLKRCTLVYEPHELETETQTMRGIMKKLCRATEALFIRRAACVIAVNDGIADWYRNTYGLNNVEVIRNLPQSAEFEPLENNYFASKFGFPASDIVFFYQGVIAKGRGIELLLSAFEMVPEDKHIVILGFGLLTETVKEIAKRRPNVHYHSPVPPDQTLRYSAAADVGVLLYENNALNNYFSYSNKYCDYLTSGMPVLFSEFLWLRGEVEQYDCGWPASLNAEALAECIRHIDRDAVRAKQQGTRNWARDNNWRNEERILDRIYSSLFRS